MTYATVLQTANDDNGGWNLIQDKTTVRRQKEYNQLVPPPTQQTPMDKRRTVFLWDQKVPSSHRVGGDYLSEINRALLKAVAPSWICIREIRRKDKGTITCITTDMCMVDSHRKYADVVIRAERIVDRGITGFEENEAWQKLKILESH
ncbi:hypothetical protein FPQ18DRAFT_308164 [Pyronema domesticum]|nr:hypothetical protein FPQ18DRAFT_308164 [Pyronema domesticum]